MKKRKTIVLTVIAAGTIMLIISWFAGRIISKNIIFRIIILIMKKEC